MLLWTEECFMKIPALLMLLLLAVQSNSEMRVIPNSLVGQWKIGKPFYDMASLPIGINAKQERTLIGTTLDMRTASVSACGTSIQITSVEATTYSGDAFLQDYRVRPDQIGLGVPVTEYSFISHGLTAICGSPEAFDIISDGKNVVLDVANDYLRLTRVKTPK
jgi:hypothetical protein